MRPLIRFFFPSLLALAGVVGLVVWWATARVGDVQARVPGLDSRPADETMVQETVGGAGQLKQGKGKPANLPGSWLMFRGADRTNIVPDKIPLARQWPAGGPKRLWSHELGEGYAGAAVHDGRVYVLDYDHEHSADALRCLSLADGEEIWCYSYPVMVKRYHGLSRTVPAIGAGQVVALGPLCHVTCVDAVTGELRWTMDLVRQFGTTVPEWYAGQCPLIDGDRVILAPAGKNTLIMAVDLKTGASSGRPPTTSTGR